MKRSPVVSDYLQMPSMYISQGSTMFLGKKTILKDGSFLSILLQSDTMFLFPGHFLGSRRTLENLFVRFRGHGLKDWLRVTESAATGIKTLQMS